MEKKNKLTDEDLLNGAKEDIETIVTRRLKKFEDCKVLYRVLAFFKENEYATPSAFSMKFNIDYDSADKTLRNFFGYGVLVRIEKSMGNRKKYHYFPYPSKKNFILLKFEKQIKERWEEHLMAKKLKKSAGVGVVKDGE